jgi:hypothetical protein
MQKVTPFLWFDDKAEEAMHFYVSLFKNSPVPMVTDQAPQTKCCRNISADSFNRIDRCTSGAPRVCRCAGAAHASACLA